MPSQQLHCPWAGGQDLDLQDRPVRSQLAATFLLQQQGARHSAQEHRSLGPGPRPCCLRDRRSGEASPCLQPCPRGLRRRRCRRLLRQLQPSQLPAHPPPLHRAPHRKTHAHADAHTQGRVHTRACRGAGASLRLQMKRQKLALRRPRQQQQRCRLRLQQAGHQQTTVPPAAALPRALPCLSLPCVH